MALVKQVFSRKALAALSWVIVFGFIIALAAALVTIIFIGVRSSANSVPQDENPEAVDVVQMWSTYKMTEMARSYPPGYGSAYPPGYGSLGMP